MRNKILKTFIKTTIVVAVILASFYFFWLSPRYTVPILTYHGFGYENDLLSVSPENFEKQMRYLSDKRYNIISLDKLVEGIISKRKFPRNTVVLTIDDGLKDNFTYAYPVLKKYGFNATIFLVSGFIGTNKRYLNWEEVVEMSKNNISFGAHTKSHVYLPSITDKDVLWEEISGSKKTIETHIVSPSIYFCYPTGGFTEEVLMLVKKAGYKGACSTNRGSDLLNKSNVYELKRISIRNIDPDYSFSNISDPVSFRAKLTGYYNIFKKAKKGH